MEGAAQAFGALAHRAEAEPTVSVRFPKRPCAWWPGGKPNPIILNAQKHSCIINVQPDHHLSGPRMLDDVVERLLRDAVQRLLDIRGL